MIWTLRVFGCELVSLERSQDTPRSQPDVHEAPEPQQVGGASGHNFDRRGEVDMETPTFGFKAVAQ